MKDGYPLQHFDPAHILAGPHLAIPRDSVRLLLEAYDCARGLRAPEWEFALEIRFLEAAGMTATHLRSLLCRGYVEQRVEDSRLRDQQRRFRRVANLSLSPAGCFVLTEAGAAFARACLPGGAGLTDSENTIRPSWDESRRELRVGVTVVKRFKQPAADQESILQAFEEEQWPPRIDDPLRPRPGQDAKRRLHSTISNLNRTQEARLIHFAGGGDGQSVTWRALVAGSASEGRAKPERRHRAPSGCDIPLV